MSLLKYIEDTEKVISYLKYNLNAIEKISDLVQHNQDFFSDENNVTIWGRNTLEVAYEKLNRLIQEYNNE